MLDKEIIEDAIAAHTSWKLRLKRAIEKGTCDYSVETVRKEDECTFGKWLHSLPDSEKNNENWINIQNLHTEFHIATANVLELALHGRKENAIGAMGFGSRFATLSSKLTIALVNWEKALI